jgi:3-isopropylmalate/(R)-2-methylmalate dehydratase small subunit
MEKFVKFSAPAAPLDVANVDTDQIIPKQFLKRVEREGFGRYLFNDWRYKADGQTNPEFVLNQPGYSDARILVAGDNFGCGSSREHAPWALADYGFKVIIAPSFADIFKNNCASIGLLTIALSAQEVEAWMERAQKQPGYTIEVDLDAQSLKGRDGLAMSFQVEPARKRRLLEGADDITFTLDHAQAIENFEQAHQRPWQAAVSAE